MSLEAKGLCQAWAVCLTALGSVQEGGGVTITMGSGGERRFPHGLQQQL